MIDAKIAVQRAIDYLVEIIPILKGTPILVEEIEGKGAAVSFDYSQGGQAEINYWLITLSYYSRFINPSNTILSFDKKEYKRFTVDASTGEIIAMKMLPENK
jgi:hypothetical protein